MWKTFYKSVSGIFQYNEAKLFLWHKHCGPLVAAAAGSILGMIDGSFPCYRGKYAKRLFSAHMKPHTVLRVCLV